jgi:NAD(P)-dependent dehydrogenase (short-subunit alcohol dehydrogenase family)
VAGKLSDSVAVVTGATRGLGKAIALALGAAGATVYVTGRSEQTGDIPGTLHETAAAVSAAGGHGVPVRCDHSDDAQIDQLFDRVGHEAGRLDLLINNAFPSGAVTSAIGLRFWEHDLSVWDDIMGVGLRSHFVASRHAVAAMSGSGGLIVNVSSAGAKRYAYGAAYGVGKAGFDKFTSDAAIELAGTGISIVSLWPGVTQTEMLDHLRREGDARLETLLHGVPTPVPSHVVGDAVVSLALDREVARFSGTHLSVKQLNEHYAGRVDLFDGRQPLATS